MVRATMNDTLLVEVRFEQDETRASPWPPGGYASDLWGKGRGSP